MKYVWSEDWKPGADYADCDRVLCDGERHAVADKNVPEEDRCMVPGDCEFYKPGEPCCEAGFTGTSWTTGI